MDIILVAVFIALAIIFFLIEIFLIPGASIAGLFGTVFGVCGVVYAFLTIGTEAGVVTLFVGVVLFAIFVYMVMKGRVLDNMSLKKSLDETVVFNDSSALHVGQRGKALSRLTPMGTVIFDGKSYEVRCLDALVDPGTEVEITDIDGTSITVKPVADSAI